MGRIGVTLSGIERSLLNRLSEANAAATLSSLRLATGNKINSPRDDPSAFVALSQLQSRLGIVTQTMSNVTAASSMVSQVQSTLDQIRTQLTAVRTELLTDEDRTLDGDERAEAQANIDAAIDQINGLAASEIDGHRLLDGSADFYVAGRNSDHVTDMRVYSTGGSSLTISGSVTATATRAELTYTGASAQVVDTATFTLTGDSGSIEISVTSGQELSTVVTEINDNSHKTGVTASLDGNDLTFTSVEYGSDAGIAIDVTVGTFTVTGGNGDGTADGTDATATINGQSYTGDGNQFSVNQNRANVSIEFKEDFSGAFDTMTASGDALTFSLFADPVRSSTLAIPGLHAARLGGLSGSLDQLASGGTLAGLDENTSAAIRVVDEALADLTRIEGAVDGFYNASITSASSLLADVQEDLEDAVDEINLVDDNEESERMLYYIDLASNSVAGLAVLSQQRAAVVNLLQQIAGLS